MRRFFGTVGVWSWLIYTKPFSLVVEKGCRKASMGSKVRSLLKLRKWVGGAVEKVPFLQKMRFTAPPDNADEFLDCVCLMRYGWQGGLHC